MSENRANELLDAYGADARRWPEGERALRERAAAPAAREAAALDRALNAYDAPFDADAFAARALASFPPTAQIVPLAPRRKLAPILALAACAAFGVVMGVGAGYLAPTDAADQTLALAFSYDLSDSTSETTTDQASDG